MSSQIETNDSVCVNDLVNDTKNEWKKISSSFCAFMDRTNYSILEKESILKDDEYAIRYFCQDIDSKMDEYTKLFNEIATCKEIVEGNNRIIDDIRVYMRSMDDMTYKIMDFIDYHHKSGRIYNSNHIKAIL